MTQKEFNPLLAQLTPHLKKVIHSMQYKRYFGIYNADDLLQEVLTALWCKVPRSYSKQKGDLKKYCMCSARNILKRIADMQYRHQSMTCTDFMKLDDVYSSSSDSYTPEQYSLAKAVNKKMRTVTNRESILFKAKLEELAKKYKTWRIVYSIFCNDGNRAKTCKELDISDSMITKTFKIVKHREQVLTAGNKKMLRYMENGVNIFAAPRVS